MTNALGRTETRTDQVRLGMLAQMAVTLGVPVPNGLPPLWHWTLFQHWAPSDELGPDGHPIRGAFIPALPELPRRMWAGGRVRFLGPLQAGDAVTRVSTIRAVRDTVGRSGRLVFVTVHHAITGPSGLAIDEEQDLVYRGLDGAATVSAEPVAEASPGPRQTLVPDPVLLFRYSALTGNGHRIHYDLDHVRQVEGYPGLLVHGPLQATLMLGLLPSTVARFHYRALRPAFHGAALRIEAWREAGLMKVRTRDPSGAVCMEGEAAL